MYPVEVNRKNSKCIQYSYKQKNILNVSLTLSKNHSNFWLYFFKLWNALYLCV